ncbi:MAG: type II toxin-antitoxin system VapC family toxin [Betaproteobacteria bacterium]|nr:type II toxin-antitoxin system VapC family toxin [Betaproteobacteria bacterium]
MLGLDTNILARYYVHEDSGAHTLAQQQAAKRIMERGEKLFVAKTVLLELEWVLRGVYGHALKDVCRVFQQLMSLPHVEIEDRATVESALGNLRRGLDFADALHHASGRDCEAFLTFDGRQFAGRARRLAITPPVRVAR